MTPALSVVIPVYNEAPHVGATLDALATAVARSGWDAEIVLVDDGSTDGTADAAERALLGRLPLRVLPQANAGRLAARRAGIDAAAAELVLLLDGRVRLHPDALAFVRPEVEGGRVVWNAHVHVDTVGNPFGAFGKVLVELAWRDYFADPRPTSYGLDEFDRYPKGTTCFLAPRALLGGAFASVRTRYVDPRHANDDTPAIRWIAAREPIHLAPGFACEYAPRTRGRAFVRHALHRGVVFLDGHGRRESRFFPLVVAFFPLSAALLAAGLRRPAALPIAAVAVAGAAGVAAAAARVPRSDGLSFAMLAPVYAAAHGAGMWHGLALLVRKRLETRGA